MHHDIFFKTEARPVRAMPPRLRLGSDFAGLDTAHWALKLLGVPHEHTFACDAAAESQTLLRHLAPKHLYTDIRERAVHEVPAVDVYTAGPPCQPYSKAGKRKRTDCELGLMIMHCVAYILTHKPKVFIIEQVPDLMQEEEFLQWLLGQLMEKYSVDMKILKTNRFGVPQTRERLYLVGILDPVQEFHFPSETGDLLPVMSFIDVLPSHDFRLLPSPGPCGGMTKVNNVASHLEQCIEEGINPFHVPVIVASGESAGRCHRAVNVMMTTTRTEAAREGYWCSMKGGFLSVDDISRLQGFPSGLIPFRRLGITETKMAGMLGNAMSLNVMMHLLPYVLVASGLIDEKKLAEVQKTAQTFSSVKS